MQPSATPGDSGSFRHVTLICGPPCSGKTTLARKLAQPGDAVLDLDAIAVQLGSGQQWRHNQAIVAEAEHVMHQALQRLARTEHIVAWVIRTLPNPVHRAQLARAIRADTVYVLAPPMREVLARARRDGRPAGTATTIRRWYRAYRPGSVDTPVLEAYLVGIDSNSSRNTATSASSSPARQDS